MQKGAIGQNLGRNIWQHKEPVAMIKALRAIIHEGASVDKAEKIFKDNLTSKDSKHSARK